MVIPIQLLLLLAATAITPLFPPASAAAAARCTAPADRDSTLRILPAYSPCSPLHLSNSSTDPFSDSTLLSLAERDLSRLLYLTSLASATTRPGPPPNPRRHRSWAPVASGSSFLQSSTYVARASLGTPPQPLLVALDTSSDAAWFPCSPCNGCPSPKSFTPIRSSSFRAIPCGSSPCSQLPHPTCSRSTSACAFNFTYGTSSISASLAADSLSLAADTIKSYLFGCVHSAAGGTSIPPQGLLGLGRGPLSFLSQTKSLYSSTFSYCLPSFHSPAFSGTLRLGPSGQPIRIRTTPLLLNPHRTSLYYVNMTGVRVGRKRLTIPPPALAFDPMTGAGTVFDSGTMFTRLVAPAYAAVRDEFRRRVRGGTVSSLGGFDTCYSGKVVVPTITFEFEGMNMTLAEENTMIHSSSGGMACLAMAAAPENVNAVVNVIASMQQQNHRVLFDLANGRIGVSREPCTSLSP